MTVTMLERFRRLMPSRESAAGNRWLRWLGPALQHPRLWHMSRRGIALGCAIGVFFGFLIPIAQIPASAALAVALRANVPSAMASTLVTNPVTFGPVYYAAWQVGDWLLGSKSAAPPPAAALAAAQAGAAQAEASTDGSWLARTWGRITGVGKPLLLGLVLFACGFGLLTWFVVDWIWRARVLWRRRRRLRAAG